MTAADINRPILAVWRIEQPRLITGLSRMLRDVTLAEDLTQEALVAALEHWPVTGVPEKPGAWLMATAKRRALAALALRMICGLTTEEIARAFLQAEATIAQRIVRAKRTLSDSGLAYETPRGEELSERLASVLEVVYLIFNEGYTAARGDEWLRPQLCNDALRMGRVLTLVAPQEAEAHGLLALMELNASRIAARTDAAGDPVLLMDQNRMLWDRLQIRRGLSTLARAYELGGGQGFYGLQAAIVACHAKAATPDDTEWP